MKSKKIYTLATIWSLFLMVTGSAIGYENKTPKQNQTRSNQASQQKETDQPTTFETVRLDFREFIKLVKEKNERIKVQHLDYKIGLEEVKNAESIFEPDFKAGYTHEETKLKLRPKDITVADVATQSEFLDDRYNYYNTAIEGLAPSGARINFGYTMEDNDDLTFATRGRWYKSFLGATITQPLLKDAGTQVTKANIHVTKAEYYMDFQAYRQEMMQVILEAGLTCWDYFEAKERTKIQSDSVDIAYKILQDNISRFRVGKMAETEVMEAKAGLALRKSEEIKAQQDLIAAKNRLRSFISSSDTTRKIEIDFAGSLETERIEPDFSSSIKTAFEMRPEYLSTRKKIEQEEIRVTYAKNQKWPQLDLIGSYGLNGLGESWGQSWSKSFDNDTKTWTVGAEFTIPLMGNKQKRSELAAARYRKRQALLELKAIEVALTNRINTAVREVYSTQERFRQNTEFKNVNQELLKVELARLAAGTRNSRDVLLKEEDLNRARLAEIESVAKHQKALMGLDFAIGSLLRSYGIDETEVIN